MPLRFVHARPAPSPSCPSGKARMLRRREHGTPGRLALPLRRTARSRPFSSRPGSSGRRRYRGFARKRKANVAVRQRRVRLRSAISIVVFSCRSAVGTAGAEPAWCRRSASLTASRAPSRICRARLLSTAGPSLRSRLSSLEQPVEIGDDQLLAKRRIVAGAFEIRVGNRMIFAPDPAHVTTAVQSEARDASMLRLLLSYWPRPGLPARQSPVRRMAAGRGSSA